MLLATSRSIAALVAQPSFPSGTVILGRLPLLDHAEGGTLAESAAWATEQKLDQGARAFPDRGRPAVVTKLAAYPALARVSGVRLRELPRRGSPRRGYGCGVASGQGKTFGAWRCEEELGSGGNGTVWRAVSVDDGSKVALKIINAKRPESEPYRRFIREITFLRDLGAFDGVLPVVDAGLPEPDSGEQPWLAMPVATPIADALNDQPLETVVEAMRSVADTLARLAAEHGAGHRDIKPGNLYQLDSAWLVGDFGLIDIPDLQELTRSDRPLGPAHYTAYEVILDPRNAPSGPADVYSLGKTLWTLATGGTWPPDGHQSAETSGFRISDFRAHPKARDLDQLVDRMTRLEPDARPSMAEVGEDLDAWARRTLTATDMEISDLSAKYRAKQAPAFARRDQEREWTEAGHAAVRGVQQRTQPLLDALLELDPRAKLDTNDELMKNVLTSVHGARRHQDVLMRWLRFSVVAAGDVHRPYGLRMGCCLDLFEDGTLQAKWMLVVGPIRTAGSDFHQERRDFEAPVGSIQQDEMLDRYVEDLQVNLIQALGVFVEKAPAAT